MAKKKTNSRPTWDEYFMEIAKVCATRATCDRRHVGAVIVKDNHIIATGYNGSPPGTGHCDSDGHMIVQIDGRDSCIRTIHAEQNAILAAARFGHGTDGSTLYITDQPCINCVKAIISSGIKKVYYLNSYGSGYDWYLKIANVEVIKIGDQE